MMLMVIGVDMCLVCDFCDFFFFKQKTAYEMRISDWSSDVCSSDLAANGRRHGGRVRNAHPGPRRVHGFAGTLRAWQSGAKDSRGRRVLPKGQDQIGRASCRERVCQYV